MKYKYIGTEEQLVARGFENVMESFNSGFAKTKTSNIHFRRVAKDTKKQTYYIGLVLTSVHYDIDKMVSTKYKANRFELYHKNKRINYQGYMSEIHSDIFEVKHIQDLIDDGLVEVVE